MLPESEAGHWTLFEELASKHDLDDPDEYESVIRVQLQVLHSVADTLPEPAREAIAIASRFHDGVASEPELEASRVAMWVLIKGRDCDFKDPFVCSIRALMCPMAPQTSNESPYDILVLFMELCDGAHVSSDSICRALRSVYGRTLSG